MKKIFMVLIIILLVFGVLLSGRRDEKKSANKAGRASRREKNDAEHDVEGAENDVPCTKEDHILHRSDDTYT